jgi:hypothetical protein
MGGRRRGFDRKRPGGIPTITATLRLTNSAASVAAFGITGLGEAVLKRVNDVCGGRKTFTSRRR